MAARMDEEMEGEMSGEGEMGVPRSKKQQRSDLKELQEMLTRGEVPSLAMLKKILKDFKSDKEATRDQQEAHQRAARAQAEKSRLEISNRELREEARQKASLTDAEKSRLESSIRELNRELCQQASLAEAKDSRSETCIDELRKELNAMSLKRDQFMTQCILVKEEARSQALVAEKRINKLEETSREGQSTTSELPLKDVNHRKAIRNLKQTIKDGDVLTQQLEEQNTEYEYRIQSLEDGTELRDAKHSLEVAVDDLDENSVRIYQLKVANAEFSATIRDEKDLTRRRNSLINSLDDDIRDLKSRIAGNNETISFMRGIIAMSDKKISFLRSSIESYTERIRLMENETTTHYPRSRRRDY